MTSPVNFALKWSTSVGVASYLQPLMHDVDADGIMEVFLIGTTDGTVGGPARLVCLKGDTGALVYQKNIDSGTGGGMHRCLVIADAFNDGRYQVFYSSNGYGSDMTCLWASNGTLLWQTNLAGAQYHVFSVADTDHTGYPYVYVVQSGDANPPVHGKVSKLWATNGTIKAQSRGFEYHCSNGGITIGDANQDGTDEVYVTDRAGRQHDGFIARGLHCFTDELQLLWNNSVPCSSFNAVLADVVPGNDQLEIVVGYQGPNGVEQSGIRVIYANGTTVPGKSSVDLDLSVHDQPAVADVDLDGRLEFFTCMGTPLKAWDLGSWSLDKNFGFVSFCPPVIANVLGDARREVVSPSGSGLRVYDNEYVLVDSLSSPVTTVIVQDVDGDGYNEILTHEHGGSSFYINAYDTVATSVTPLPNTRTPFYGDSRLNAENPGGEYNRPPVAQFTTTLEDKTILFDATSSFDPDGSIVSWVWDYGDGVSETGEMSSHTYHSAGVYTVTLQVRDDQGAETICAQEVVIEDAPVVFLPALVIGKIHDFVIESQSVTFAADVVVVIHFAPLRYHIISGEQITLARDWRGVIVENSFLITFCRIRS
jgi:PKD repeat protein